MTFKAITLAALAAATTLAGAGAASAQDFRGGFGGGWGFGPPPAPQPISYGYGYGDGFALRAREDRMQGWIDASVRGGRLSYWRAERAQGDLNAIRADQRRDAFFGGGLNGWQAARLNGRLDQLAGFIRTSDDGGYGGGYPPRW